MSALNSAKLQPSDTLVAPALEPAVANHKRRGQAAGMTQFFGSPAQEQAAAQPQGAQTIFLVEDDASVRRLARLALGGMGYQILEASNGVEALQLWESHHGQVDLLFTDMMMPEGLTGLELAEQLRQLRPDLKVLLSSGYSAELVASGLRLPPNTKFLSKPYPINLLAETVRECLENKSQ